MKASKHIQYYKNINGPTISNVSCNIIESNGKYYKDIDGSNTVSNVNNWELDSTTRAKALVQLLPLDIKLAQLFISDWRMGKYPGKKSHFNPIDPDSYVLDKSGLLDEASHEVTNIFGTQIIPGTTEWIKKMYNRHFILRANAPGDDIADYLNQMQSIAEECDIFIPLQAVSNSRNENGEAIFGMNDASGMFTTYPNTLGIASATLGSDLSVIKKFGHIIKNEWDSCGLKKGYMYMADICSDPRWLRTYGTFGENPEFVASIFDVLVPTIQGDKQGINKDGVALTVKHFPGGGARENGFDPHYKEGQWNLYKTAGSLEKYHLPSFQAAINQNVSAIMPYYAKPSLLSAKQMDGIEMLPYGFAYNKPFIHDLLIDQLGFKGYINSDTGIIHSMSWGVEDLDEAERVAFAINNGVSLISGNFDQHLAKIAYERGQNDYYSNHEIKPGFSKEQLTLSMETIDHAITKTFVEMFDLGLFDNPYRDVSKAKESIGTKEAMKDAYDAHLKSITLLKHTIDIDLSKERVFIQVNHINQEQAQNLTNLYKNSFKDIHIVDDICEATCVIIALYPKSGNYFNATKGFLELDLCTNKVVYDVVDGKPVDTTHMESTLANYDSKMLELCKQRGQKIIGIVNITLPWILGNFEPYVDNLYAIYDTFISAIADVLMHKFKPQGKLPLTLPRNDDVILVRADGNCNSPNDVPGYDKDLYIDDRLKDENGKAYAYKDCEGNYYEYNFGL